MDGIVGKKLPATLRRKEILSALQKDGHINIVDFAEKLGVSDMTVRRDLESLAEEKLVVRTHGGAHLPGMFEDATPGRFERNSTDRRALNRDKKQRIARAALGWVQPHTTIALDIGTTAYELATLMTDSSVRIVSTSLPIQIALAERNMSVFAPCGQIGGIEPSISGAQTISYLQNFNFDVCFLGVAGITLGGMFDFSFNDAEIKKAIIKHTSKRVLLADSSKFGMNSSVRVSSFDQIDALITDAEPPGPLCAQLQQAGTEIIIAGF
ncbi:DeoR/GlpR family DNA-binding transcription regulator [Paracoccus sp. SCSIO 75233]|uniref:DeoR/GlpR family DNA-binding transcription regulator n=1 Tax=Paracoccus sp. SCSIO 75233 TaxID=3017782 RepID=UPI0022F0A72C|nr:DeoR/GlpR family DNA-binding transcription regulator [Paracoccus sp. SCSIO 75233]WBU55259.1 DeoR/GlpR family DNA-binding transcription regulator [Paracoccus sp. SCSIO 75233]